jgi:hypothetical protein
MSEITTENNSFIAEQTKSILMFLANVKPNFIQEVWGTSHLTQHFEEKLQGFVSNEPKGYRTFDVMVRFMLELDHGNLKMLTRYIVANH